MLLGFFQKIVVRTCPNSSAEDVDPCSGSNPVCSPQWLVLVRFDSLTNVNHLSASSIHFHHLLHCRRVEAIAP